MSVPLASRFMAPRVARAPWLFAERLSDTAATGNHAVDQQQEQRTDDRCNEACPLILAVPSDLVANEAGQKGSGDAEQDRDDAPARVASLIVIVWFWE
jgi:hypothetical protein